MLTTLMRFVTKVSVLICQVEQSRRRWNALKMFGGDCLEQELSGNDINKLTNMIALQHDAHERFGNFRLWFKRVPVCLHSIQMRYLL
jgi:HNH endonuclease